VISNACTIGRDGESDPGTYGTPKNETRRDETRRDARQTNSLYRISTTQWHVRCTHLYICLYEWRRRRGPIVCDRRPCDMIRRTRESMTNNNERQNRVARGSVVVVTHNTVVSIVYVYIYILICTTCTRTYYRGPYVHVTLAIVSYTIIHYWRTYYKDEIGKGGLIYVYITCALPTDVQYDILLLLLLLLLLCVCVYDDAADVTDLRVTWTVTKKNLKNTDGKVPRRRLIQ